MSFEYYQSVIGKMRKGTADDSFVDVNETLQVVNSKVVLSEIPDKFNGLVVKTVFGNTALVEIKKGTPTDNQYLCDYNLGVVHFSDTVNNERYVFSYKGRGAVYLAAERIYTKQMNSEEIIQTLRDVLDEADSIINLSERFTNTGAYSATKVYYGRNIVTYDNAAYMCINHSADGIINIPPTNTTHWTQMVSVKQAVEAANAASSSANDAADNAETQATYAKNQGDYAKGIRDNFGHKGDYSPTATYKNGNVVTYGGINYFCIQDTTAGIDPLNGAYWTIVSPQASINDETWTATEGQTVFTITNGNYVPDQGNIEVWVGGVPQVSGVGYTETNNTTITLSEGVTAGTTVFAKWYEGHMSISKGHKSSHALGGQDEIDLTQLRNYKEKVSDEFDRIDEQLAEKAAQDDIAEIGSLKTNAANIGRNTFFNADATNGSTAAPWSDRQIVLLGDSHGWGEGSPNYQGISAGYSIHAPWIHNKSFMDRLRLYLEQKFDSEPWRVAFSTGLSGGDGAVKEVTGFTNGKINKPFYTISPQIIGKFSVLKDTSSSHQFRSAAAKNDEYGIEYYRHNSDIGLFHQNLIVLGQNANGAGEILVDIPKPSRYVFIHFGAFAQTTNIRVELLDNSAGEPVKVSNFGNVYYGTKLPTVTFLNNVSRSIPHTLTSDYIDVDTNYADYDNVVMKIDFGQKKEGTLRIKVVGTTGAPHAIIGKPAFISRGILFGNGDLVRNWSMGGHTVGAWLGEEGNWDNAETRDHLTDILAYMSGTLKGAIIEAPLVNERIKQTPIATFKTRLTTLKTRMGTGNIIIFTTLGEKNYEFQGATATLNYDHYANAVSEWAVAQAEDVTFVDCRKYIKGLVSSGVIGDYNDLYINNAHPSPMVNELMYGMVKRVVDMKF